MTSSARQLGVLLLAFSFGCASAPSRWDLTPKWIPGIRTSKQDERPEDKKKAPEQVKEEREPLIAKDQSTSSAIVHDPATRMLIEAELRDAAPEDRAEWMALLESVNSDQVPSLLQMRRIASSSEAEKPQVADTKTSTSGDMKSVQPASGESVSTKSESSKVIAASAATTTELTHLDEPTTGPKPTQEATSHQQLSKTTPGEILSPAGWPQKIRSLADPTRIWTNPAEAVADSMGAGEKAGGEKPERTTFGLPLIIGSQAKADAALADFHSREAIPEASRRASALPPQTPAARLTPGSALWEDEIQKLISLLEAETSVSGSTDGRDDLRKQVALRMLYLIENQPQKAQQVIPGVPDYEQEFWTDLFLGLAEHLDRSGATDAGERATQTIGHLRSAAFRLQQNAKLRLRNMVFCQRINGFGEYETFLTDHFSPGQTVLIYSEIRNFSSQATDDGTYRTRIRSTIEIYSNGNEQQLVDRSSFEATEDLCRTLRTDYFHSYRITLPAHLTRGPHLLKLVIQDELSGKISTESIPFLVD